MSRLCGYNTKDAKQSVDKYTSKEYFCALKGYIYILPAILCIIVLSIMTMTGCSKNESKEHEVIDYTVVENEDLPAELKKLIDNKKPNTLRMTYTTKDYTYVVAGFGTKETSGYSIKVNDVYKSGNAIYADFALMGPAENEPVNEVPTTPYIVLKYEKRDETVVFRM